LLEVRVLLLHFGDIVVYGALLLLQLLGKLFDALVVILIAIRGGSRLGFDECNGGIYFREDVVIVLEEFFYLFLGQLYLFEGRFDLVVNLVVDETSRSALKVLFDVLIVFGILHGEQIAL